MDDRLLSDEERDFRRAARDFLTASIEPYRRDWDREEAIDASIVKALGEFGFLGLTLPVEDGGTPCNYRMYAIAMEELGRADSSVRGIVSVTLGLVAKSIAAHGTTEQRALWLNRLCSGDAIGCFGLTEPDNGSDAAALTTRARREGDHVVINGTKTFITNGTMADVCLLFARTGEAGPRGISAFLVPLDSPGVTRREIHGKLGLRAQATAELHFDDVVVPATAMLGAEGQGFQIAMSALDRGRISVAAGCVGIVQACLDESVTYSCTRFQFSRPIASFQLVQQMIARMAVDAAAARGLVYNAIDLMASGEQFGTAASMAKYFASEAAVRAANDAVQIFGGWGYIDEFPVQKMLRDARVMTLYEGTSQIQELLIGRAMTGVSAFI
jgi:alkylation response protein AidB-like acyl-CoA dehydrogenase